MILGLESRELYDCHPVIRRLAENPLEYFSARFLRDSAQFGVLSHVNTMNIPRDSLSEVLLRWRVTPPADPNFRSAVWQRIGDRTKESWTVYLRSHAITWAVMSAMLLAAAAYTGHSTAQARVRADREAIVVSYLADLDPRVQAALRP